jgi:hypothetical protein
MPCGNANEDCLPMEIRKKERKDADEDVIPQAKEKMEMSMRMAFLKQRGRWKCQ